MDYSPCLNCTLNSAEELSQTSPWLTPPICRVFLAVIRTCAIIADMVTRTGGLVDARTAANRRLKPWHVLALLLLTLLTALPPLLLVPPTTKSDETYHWAYATYVAQTGALPPYLSPDDATSREAHQPPLYYALAALSTRHFADPAAFANRVVNQFFMTTTRGNRNFDILGPDAAQAFWIGRWLSLAFWLCVPLAALWAWLPIWARGGSLTAAALIALTPLQAFVGTSYSNDMPSVAFMAVAVGALLRLLDPKRAPQWRWCILLGVSLGLSMLSKLYALPLMGAIGVIAITPIPKLEARRRWQLLAALALTVVLMVPWMLDSYRRFGDPLGMSVFSQVMGRGSGVVPAEQDRHRRHPGLADILGGRRSRRRRRDPRGGWLWAGRDGGRCPGGDRPLVAAGPAGQPLRHHRPAAGTVGIAGAGILRLDFPPRPGDGDLRRPQYPLLATGQRTVPCLRSRDVDQN